MTKSLNVGLKSSAAIDSSNRIARDKQNSGTNIVMSQPGGDNGILSKSLASFHLTPGGNGLGAADAELSGGKPNENRQKILMDQSVDQLFKEGEAAAAQLINPAEKPEDMPPNHKPNQNSINQVPHNKFTPDSIALRQTTRNQQVFLFVKTCDCNRYSRNI